MLSDKMKHKITGRAINDIALLSLYNNTVLERTNFNKYKEDIIHLDNTEFEDIINTIFTCQCNSIDTSAGNNIDYIKIPVLGSIRLNKARQNILKTIHAQGTITDEQIQSIIDDYVTDKKNRKCNDIVDVNIEYNGKQNK